MTSDHSISDIIIIGGGQAGDEVATQLRQQGFDGKLILISEESLLPYQRPLLSKAFLAGDVTFEQLLIKAPLSYEKSAIELHINQRVEHINRHDKRIRLSNGDLLPYDKLILATGGRPRTIKVPGAELKDIFYLRTVADVEFLQPAFQAGRRVVIVGGGYIGLEVASIAVKSGLDVTVLEGAPRVLARVTSPEMSAFYERVHRGQGVKIRTGVAVSGFLPNAANDAVGLIECGEDESIPADLVIVGIGLIPNTELAEEAGLLVDNGIVVNEHEQSSDPHIYAIGDCSSHAHHGFLLRKIRLESVPNAIEQARIVAAAICEKPLPAVTPPWFWSDQYKLKLQMVGLSDGYEDLVLRGNPDGESFITFYFKNHEIISADAVNRPGEFMLSRKLVAERKVIRPAALADESQPLKAIVANY
jgi:3-phenylpropionate/trans-cinnamate dioxygenase ferredoxin reductase subunit